MVKTKKQTNKNYLTLKTVSVNAGLKSWYRQQLVKLVKVMVKVYEKQIISLYKSNNEQIKEIRYATDDNIGSQSRILLNKLNKVYSKYYDKKSKDTSEEMVKKTEKLLKKSLEASFFTVISKLADKNENNVINKLFGQFSPEILNNKEKFMKAFSLNIKLYSQVNDNLKKTIVMNNAELIKTIQQQYHKEISQQVYECIVNGKPQKELMESIKVVGNKTTRRARLIADDQCNKAHSVLYRQELKQNGITKAKWVHIGGGKTDRKTHIDKAPNGLNGAIFDLRKGIYDPTVEKNIQPAELPFCRCIAMPIVEV